MNDTTTTAKSAVRKNTDFTVFSFIRDTFAALQVEFPVSVVRTEMIRRPPVNSKIKNG